MRTPETEVDGGFFFGLDKLGQIVAGAKPGQNAVAFPTPGNHFLTREVCVQVPAMFLRVFFDSTVQPVIVPAQRYQDTFLSAFHVARKRLTVVGPLICFVY